MYSSCTSVSVSVKCQVLHLFSLASWMVFPKMSFVEMERFHTHGRSTTR